MKRFLFVLKILFQMDNSNEIIGQSIMEWEILFSQTKADTKNRVRQTVKLKIQGKTKKDSVKHKQREAEF